MEPPARGFVALAAGIVMAATAMGLSRVPGFVERAYAAEVGPRIARWLSLLTGWVPFSVAALLAGLLVAALAIRSVRAMLQLRGSADGTGSAAAVLFRGASTVAGTVGLLLLLFYPLWGFNYARAPLDVRLGIVGDGPLDGEALAALTRLAAGRTNEAYRVLHDGVDDAGVPSRGRPGPVESSRTLEVGWERVAGPLLLGSVAAQEYGPVKTRGVTWLIDALDIAGIYVPFTGEAHASAAQPDLSFPAVAAHEQAHQRGIARENEATFAGVLAAIHADDPLAVYSGWARILRALQTDLVRVDRAAWAEIRAELLPGVLRDWRDYIDYLRDSRSAAAPVVEATNDAYLRAHGVPGGVESYDRVTTLLLEWARQHEGDLLVEDTRTAAGGRVRRDATAAGDATAGGDARAARDATAGGDARAGGDATARR